MNLTRGILPFALALTFTLSSNAGDVLLRPTADQHATVIGRIPQSHKAFKQGTTVTNSDKAAQGWHQTTVKTSYEGYIPTEELGKNFSVQPGTRIRVNASTNAATLTICEAHDHIEVSSISEDRAWATVRFNKAVTVYYLISELPDTVAVDIQNSRRKTKTESGEPAARVAPSSLPPEKTAWKTGAKPIEYTPPPSLEPERTNDHGESSSIMVESTSNSSPTNLESSNEAVIRHLIGTLQRERGSAPVSYPLRLYQGNKRIAYVDISGIFISDLRPYLDQQVLIQGELHARGFKDSVPTIHARSIQLSE